MKRTNQLISSLVLACTTTASLAMQQAKLNPSGPPAWLHEVSKFYGTQNNNLDHNAFGKALCQSGILKDQPLPQKIQDAYNSLERPIPDLLAKLLLTLPSTRLIMGLILYNLKDYNPDLAELLYRPAGIVFLAIPILIIIHHLYQKEQKYTQLGKAVIKAVIKPD